MKKSKKRKAVPDMPEEARAADETPDEANKPEAEAETAAPEESIDPGERIAQLEDALLRAKAEYQNFQRRSAIERSEVVRYANADMMKSMLNVMDDFERSLGSAESSDDLEAWVDGVRLIYENLLKALRTHGLDHIDALHQPFDPTIHEALLQQPSADHPPGTVVEQIAKGYRLRDRVLRPARVIVAKKVDAETGQEARMAPATDNNEHPND